MGFASEMMKIMGLFAVAAIASLSENYDHNSLLQAAAKKKDQDVPQEEEEYEEMLQEGEEDIDPPVSNGGIECVRPGRNIHRRRRSCCDFTLDPWNEKCGTNSELQEGEEDIGPVSNGGNECVRPGRNIHR